MATAGIRSSRGVAPIVIARRKSPGRDASIVRRLSGWFEESARKLPWRTVPRDPYRSLVSEFMLQQTQVVRVLEKFGPFLERFPTLKALAAADEDAVLSAWSGLGYYRRARLLHACARAIVERFGGVVPRDAAALETLPGIGRYTAGAIASIVFGEAEAIVDGNVCRVLQRLEGKEGNAGEKRIAEWAWGRSEELVRLTVRGATTAAFNEGLMELGATVCTPGAPKCGECALRDWCIARARGEQDSIPGVKSRAARSVLYHNCLVVRSGDGRVLVEQRPGEGMWASMWQAPTLESKMRPLSQRALLRGLRLDSVGASDSKPVSSRLVFRTTHREVHFRIWTLDVPRAIPPKGAARRWVTRRALESLALSNAHRQILLAPPPD